MNKTFLASTLRGVDTHNRRQEEDKCWTLRQMEHKVHEARDRRRSSLRSNDRNLKRIKRERNLEKSRSRSRSRQFRRSRSRSGRSSSQTSQNRSGRKNETEERIYWARKKADKTRKLWENLYSEGTVLVENAPDYSSDESNDDDIKPGKRKSSSFPNGTKHKDKQHRQKSDEKMKRR